MSVFIKQSIQQGIQQCFKDTALCCMRQFHLLFGLCCFMLVSPQVFSAYTGALRGGGSGGSSHDSGRGMSGFSYHFPSAPLTIADVFEFFAYLIFLLFLLFLAIFVILMLISAYDTLKQYIQRKLIKRRIKS